MQQISSYNKQKLESKQQLKLKICITWKEKDDQNVSRILNQRKVSRIPRPMKKESDIVNQQKSVRKGFSTPIQHQPAQRRNAIQNLSVLEELVRPESVPQNEDQNVSAAGDRGDQNGIKESINADQENRNHQIEPTTRQEDNDNVDVQQHSSGTVQHELTARYVTGYLNQQPVVYLATPYFLGGPHVLLYQPTSSFYWSLCPTVLAGSYHTMY